MKKYYWSVILFLSAVLSTSCSEQLETIGQTHKKETRIKAVYSNFTNGENISPADRNSIEDLQACLFEEGIITQIYTNLNKDNEEYQLKLDRMSGTLYMLANTARLIDLNQMLASGITEEEWLKTTVDATDGKPLSFLTGFLKLDEQTNEAYSLPLNLKRGVARFDLHIQSKNTVVHSVTLKQIKQQGFLLEQEEVASPETVEYRNLAFNFDQPLQHDSLGLAYVYEQWNPDARVAVEISINNRMYQLEEPLPRKLKRNSIYTLTIRKEHQTEKVMLEVKAWENGGESSVMPDLDSRLTINPADSQLPEGAYVEENGEILVLPHTAADFILAVNADEELESDLSLSESMGIEKVETAPGKNLFRIRKKLVPPGVPVDTTMIYFHRKGLQHTYDTDYLRLVFQPNPIQLEGDLSFNAGDYTCDFRRYIDNELGRFILPEGYELEAECPKDDPWLKVEVAADNGQTYRIIGGWKPNDPNADGRSQAADLIVRRTSDGKETERYTVRRQNWGLPVTKFNGIWWCKYNAIGNSRSFEDQIICPQDPARLAGKTVREYLKDCPQEVYLKLWNSAYEGNDGIALEAVYRDEKWTLDGWRQNEPVHINGLDAKALSPDGYEMPSFEDYKRILGIFTIPTHWAEYNPINGGADYRSRIIWETRNDIYMDENALGALAFFSMESIKGHSSEPLTFYGIGSQWDKSGINANNFLIANYNPTNLKGFFINGGRALNKNGAGGNNTRLIRFKKSPVEYIYGTDE